MDYFAALAATWPAMAERRDGWTLRRGKDGGNRVTAATREDPAADPRAADAAMRGMGRRPLFMIRPGEEDLDAALAAMGYRAEDATRLLAAPTAAIRQDGVERAVIRCQAPLARMVEIWHETGIDQGRLAVMDRAPEPRVYLLARDGDRPAGVAFAAGADGVAMVHALAVAPFARRKGLARRMTRAAAGWAGEAGARELALAVTVANTPALALYLQLGFVEKAAYHYRRAPA